VRRSQRGPSSSHAARQDAQNKLREAPTAEEVAWLRDREKSFSAALEKMKQEYGRRSVAQRV
jgi:hypothetical protein